MGHIDEKLNIIKNSDSNLSKFFNELKRYNPIIIGGFIRNIINNEEVRDIDIILNTEDYFAINRIVNKLKLDYRINQFDGYKIIFNNITIDLWYIKNHNLFKKGIYNIDVNNLKDTTFINYDSLIYDINNKKLDIDYYQECINSNTIDFVGNNDAIINNPKPYLSIVKILELSYKKGFNISNNVNIYIDYYYNYNKDNFINILNKEYNKHYSKELSIDFIEYINKYINKIDNIKIKYDDRDYIDGVPITDNKDYLLNVKEGLREFKYKIKHKK